MKMINNKWKVTVALVALFGLASCTNAPVDNGGSTGSTGYGSGTSSGTGGTGNGGGYNTGGTTTGGGYNNGSSTNNSGSGNAGNANTTGFVVQLVATNSSAKAQGVKNTFVTEGYKNTTVNTVTINGQPVYRVQIGPFGTQADGDRVLAQMKRRYHKNQYVNAAVVKTIYGR